MAAPTTLTITYTSGSYTYNIPQVSGVPIDYTQAVKNVKSAGGFWITSATGVASFIPWSQVTAITAQ